MVRGINRDQSRPAIGIDFRGYGERTLPRAQDMPGILEQNVVCLCDPVGFRETLAQRRKFLVRKPQRGLQALLLRLYRSEEHTSELQSLMRISYAVFCLKKK